MSISASIKQSLIILNGKFLERASNIKDVSVKKTESGTQFVMVKLSSGDEYMIQGGRDFGGSPQDWFAELASQTEYSSLPSFMKFKSRAEAIRALNNA